MRLAIVDSDNKVVNVIMAPEDVDAGSGYRAIASDTANKRDIWNGSSFDTPEPVLGSTPTTLQAAYRDAATQAAKITVIAGMLGLLLPEE
jgi:hypothetical protein